MDATPQSTVKKPPFRKLRAYAFDPSLSLRTDTADINSMVYKVVWEQLAPGPVGEYVEVIDFDPTIHTFYKPVDLNNPYILAQDGLEPSESNPQFHQQMVYAVAMTTIKNFEKALGRRILWAPRLLEDRRKFEEYVPRLRIYPHALREANAYYSPAKKALLFGYFSSAPADKVLHMPDSLVFTCLSHDIIAHEVTHAILDGMHYYYNEPSNPDVLAFHEAFADLVNRLANEAAKAASHVLGMCIRALDYCPPLDITFGEYLRAIITADADLVQDDARDYRLAFIDAFRRRGIYPAGIKTLSEESLRYSAEPLVEDKTRALFAIMAEFLQEYRNEVIYKNDRKEIYLISRKYIGGTHILKGLHNRIRFRFEESTEFEKLTGLVFMAADWSAFGVRTAATYKDGAQGPSFRVQDLRLVSRTGPLGNQVHSIIFSLVQRAGVVVQGGEVSTFVPAGDVPPPAGGFEFWGGCTLIFDLDTLQLRYAIAKPLLDPDKLRTGQRALHVRRVLKQHRYQTEEGLQGLNEQSLYFGSGLRNYCQEPFAFLHRK